jgi:dCMP deaminase
MSINWDDLFMAMVYLVAMKSKDERTHIGAVVVDKEHIVRSMGYNGLPRHCNDDVLERQKAPEKYYWFEHAERNAIYNARTNLSGCTMYTNGIPCADCARAVIQAGIKEVVVDENWGIPKAKWKKSVDKGEEMLREAGVSIRHVHRPILNITAKRGGKEFKIR